MSSLFGEIGFKIGARALQNPLVNLVVQAVGQQQPQNGTLGLGAAALTALGVVGTKFAVQVLNTGAAGFLANGLWVNAGQGVGDRPLLVTGGANNTSTFLSMDGNGNAAIGWNTQGKPSINLTNGATVAVAGAIQVFNNGSSIQYAQISNNGLTMQNVASAGGGFVVNINEPAVANATLLSCGQNGVPAVVLGTSSAYAWGTGTHYPILQMQGVGALFGTATMGLVLTGGGLYYNGTNYIYGQAGTGAIASIGTGSFTISCVSTSGTAGGTGTLTTVFAIGGTVTSNKIQGYGPNAAALVDMTPDTGVFSMTITGINAAVNIGCRYRRSGSLVVLSLNTAGTLTVGTSTSTTFTVTGLPAAIQPVAGTYDFVMPFLVDNSSTVTTGMCQGEIDPASGTITFFKNNGSWTAAGTKGFSGNATICYLLD